MKKRLLLICGCLLLALGAVGVFLPVLPTTPFVIAAAACFSAGAPHAARFLEKNRFFGPYIENWRTKQGVPLETKIKAIILLWLMLAVSGYFIEIIWVRILLAAVGVGVTIHLGMIKTSRPKRQDEPGSAAVKDPLP